MPNWNAISISGYHIREAGSTDVQEVAFTLANGIAYVEAAVASGLAVDEFAPQLSFFFNAHNEFLDADGEVPRGAAAVGAHHARALRRERSALDDAALSRADGGLVADRAAAGKQYRARRAAGLAAVLGGCQSLHANGLDEALALPTENAALLALRTQQIIAHETGVANTIDPVAGSYAIEKLTDEIEAGARALHRKDRRDGRHAQSHRSGIRAGRNPKSRLRISASRRYRRASRRRRE